MNRFFLGIVFPAVLVTGGLLYVERTQIYSILVAFKLVPLEEPMTELYFNDTDSLPQSTAKPIAFSFTIHNLEGQDMTYPYVVSVQFEGGRILVVDKNTIPIAKGDSAKIPESFRAQPGASMIFVDLPEQKQHISFLVR